jgi:DNA-binding beta-propeller fold protein YncE
MTVNRHLAIAAVAALAGAAVAPDARAQSATFTFAGGVFQDDKEVPLKAPEGVACDDAGNLVVADTGNGRLVFYRYVGGSLSPGTPVKPAGLTSPMRLQFDSKGNLWVLDGKTRRIFKLDGKGTVLSALDPKGGPSVTLPVAFKLDGADQLYVVDAVGAKVLVFDPAGALVRQLDLPKGTVAVRDVHVDSSGNVYVVDGTAAAIWVSEKGTAPFKPFTQGMKDKMNFPTYLTGNRGRLFVVDQFGNGIAVLGADGAFQGRQLSIGWSDGLVYYPSQLCMNAAGEAFVADRGNNRVQIFNTAR